MAQKLNQVLAIERTVKGRAHGKITSLHHSSKHANLFNGLAKTYEPKDEDGEAFPPESQLVQLTVPSVLKDVRRALVELFDVTATKDKANSAAVADVVLDGKTLLAAVPATTLIFLEKQLTDLNTFVSELPTLDPAQEWHKDEATALWKTAPQKTHKTKKVQRPIVLYQATEHHPAQTQLITEDVIVGHWSTVKHSGAMLEREKATLLDRIERLLKAVKYAREQANQQPAPDVLVGEAIFGYLYGD